MLVTGVQMHCNDSINAYPQLPRQQPFLVLRPTRQAPLEEVRVIATKESLAEPLAEADPRPRDMRDVVAALDRSR